MDLKVLMLEDNEVDADLITRQLKKDNLSIIHKRVDTRDEFIGALSEFKPDIILSDHSLPQFNSLAALELAKKYLPQIPFILVTGTVSEEFAVACIKSGADDYILKSNLARLSSSINISLEKHTLATENVVIKRLNEEIKEKNRDITDSINYALRLQQALMQEKEDLKEHFPQSFIMLLPKHILSGDFYWFKEIDNRCLIAAVDCTGHGVPGALLTIMGMNILHAAFNTQKNISAESLLNYLDADFDRKLRHKKNGKTVQDAMDIAVCEIDRDAMTLSVAGANRQICLVRDGNLQLIATDKYNIGTADAQKKFGVQQIQLKKDDMIYMFSDGFQDQFGGETGKKLGSARFREMLLALSNSAIDKQESLVHSFLTDWQGKEEQTDDILLIGIKV